MALDDAAELSTLLRQALDQLHDALAKLRASKSLTVEETKNAYAASMAACEVRGLLQGAGLGRPDRQRRLILEAR